MQHGQCSGVKKEPYDTVEHDRWSGMKVKKEEQQELNQDNVWAKLVPVDSRYSEIDMVMQETGVFSEITSSSPVKQNWCVISRKNLGETIATVTVRNTSAGTILVDGSAVQREDTVDIHNGSIIVAGSELKGYLHYTFKILQPQGLKNEQARLTISLDVANSKCSICLNIWHDVVTVAPCLHNFCNGCFTEWLKSSQNNYKNVICPQCRVTILSVGRNHFLHNIEETILLNFPLLKRSKEELALLDQSATVQTYLVFGTQGSQSRKRPAPTGDYDDMDSRCPQCVKKLGGFKCNQSTIHLQCHVCHGLMPSRPDFGVPQN
ncbi:E3 ubiquitin-protein ligase CHFR, partial [Zostera marina]